jgi:hypothetical protein
MLTDTDLDTHTITLTAEPDIYKSQTYPKAATVMCADCSWADDQSCLGGPIYWVPSLTNPEIRGPA